MSKTTPHRFLSILLAAALAVAACGSGTETTTTTTPTSEPTATTTTPPATDSSTDQAPAEATAGDPADPASDAGMIYCAALDNFFVAQNRVITEGIEPDEATWTEIITELDVATPVAAAAAPDNHQPILTGFGEIVSRMAALSYAEFEAHPTINDEASEYFFGDLFIISSHASEVCGLDISFEVEIDVEPNEPIVTDVTATCETLDDEYFRVIWTNETAEAVDIDGRVVFTAADGRTFDSSFDVALVGAGEQLTTRAFSFDGTAEGCEVTELNAYAVSNNFFFEPAEPGDVCTIRVGDAGAVDLSAEAVALRDGDVQLLLAFYDESGARTGSTQVVAYDASEGDAVTITDYSEVLFSDGAVRCEVLGRFDF